MTTQSVSRPEGWAAAYMPTSRTMPEVGACTAAEIQPSASPIIWPFSTLSPTCTRGRGVPPMLWCRGTATTEGRGALAMGRVTDLALLVAGLTPPLNLNSCIRPMA